jgi:hypothetical protein
LGRVAPCGVRAQTRSATEVQAPTKVRRANTEYINQYLNLKVFAAQLPVFEFRPILDTLFFIYFRPVRSPVLDVPYTVESEDES